MIIEATGKKQLLFQILQNDYNRLDHIQLQSSYTFKIKVFMMLDSFTEVKKALENTKAADYIK